MESFICFCSFWQAWQVKHNFYVQMWSPVAQIYKTRVCRNTRKTRCSACVFMMVYWDKIMGCQQDTLGHTLSLRACFSGDGTTTWVRIDLVKHHPWFNSDSQVLLTLNFSSLLLCHMTKISSLPRPSKCNITRLFFFFLKLYCGLPHNAFITRRHTCLCLALWIDRGWFYTGNMSHASLLKNRTEWSPGWTEADMFDYWLTFSLVLLGPSKTQAVADT